MKRSRQSVFDAVELLNHQDAKAVKSQRRASQRDRQRSEAAQSQTKIYGSLVETRILLQRSLQAQQQQSHDDAAAAVDRCSNLLAQLLNARQTLFPVHDTNEHKPDYETLVQQNDEDALSNSLQSEFEHHQKEWKEVLDRRNKDARLHSGALSHKTQFRVVDSSFWQQVEATVQHEELRQQQHQHSQSGSPAVFDDTKVYQHLLKDFVATSNGDAQAAAQQRLAKLNKKATSNSSSKKKAQVDRRASKGRKIRYTEIPKLGKCFILVWWAYMLIGPH